MPPAGGSLTRRNAGILDRVTTVRLVAIVAGLAAASPAMAAPDAPAPVVAAGVEKTAAEVAGAPVPGEESGRIDPVDGGDSTLRRIGRGVLFVPRGVMWLAFAPVRGAVWVFERYQVQDRTRRIFFNDEGTAGLYPTVRRESGFGLTMGARFVHRDLFGAGEKLSVHAGGGGRFRELYQASLETGDRLGGYVALGLAAEYEGYPKDAYYGIGNGDDGAQARFQQRFARVAAVADVHARPDLQARLSGAYKDVDFARSDEGAPIDEQFPPEALVGFAGLRHAYAELELRWDTRRAESVWSPISIHSAGWLVAGYAGRVTALEGGESFWRFGADLQGFVAVGDGPRVIAGRLHAEAVDQGRDEIAFTELPRLGGKTYLRGYPLDRFRDRVAVLASLDYQWDLARIASASLFTDVGRVAPSIGDVDFSGLRVGYGVALDLHTDRSPLIRVMLASSIDGGLLVEFAFDTVFDLDRRVDRR